MKQELLRWGKRITSEVAKHSPGILTGVAVVGTVATAYFASKATLQAKSKLDMMIELETNGEEPFTMKDKARNILPLYIPTFIMFTTTAACIIGANEINAKRQMALASAYSLSTEALKELQDKVKDTYGEKKYVKLTDEINEEKGRKLYFEKKDMILDTGHGDQVFVDITSGQVFRSSMEHVRSGLIYVKERISEGEEVSLNDLYRKWGIREVKDGDYKIWDINITGRLEEKITSSWVDPETKEISCTCLDFYNDPVSRKEY